MHGHCMTNERKGVWFKHFPHLLLRPDFNLVNQEIVSSSLEDQLSAEGSGAVH